MSEHLTLSRSVKGLTVLVTGAASGMGRATARVFADEGANVAVTDFNGEGAQAVAQDITAAGGSARAWSLDVSDPAAIRRVVDDSAAHFGGLDCLVNNAGVSAFNAIDDDGYEAVWDRAVTILLTAHQRMIRASLPHLRKSASPRIVNIASTEALGATARNSPYAAAKAGVTGLTRALAVELGPEGITVNAIGPGATYNEATKAQVPEAVFQMLIAQQSVKRPGQSSDFYNAMRYLCSDGAAWVTGQTLYVNGGFNTSF